MKNEGWIVASIGLAAFVILAFRAKRKSDKKISFKAGDKLLVRLLIGNSYDGNNLDDFIKLSRKDVIAKDDKTVIVDVVNNVGLKTKKELNPGEFEVLFNYTDFKPDFKVGDNVKIETEYGKFDAIIEDGYFAKVTKIMQLSAKAKGLVGRKFVGEKYNPYEYAIIK